VGRKRTELSNCSTPEQSDRQAMERNDRSRPDTPRRTRKVTAAP
jgi:hypothetical protein